MAQKVTKTVEALMQAEEMEAAARSALDSSEVNEFTRFELDSIERGRASLRFDATSRHKQLLGVVHGGILAALADTTAAMAAATVVPKGTPLATIELKINYLEALPGGRVRANARVLRAGRNFVVCECEISGADGKLAAKALLTFGAAGGYAFGERGQPLP
jgi:uncharacterized protein (TIGR00369 family)